MAFSFFGGVHPKENKWYACDKETQVFPEPDIVVIPMSQHIGAPCNPLVKKGDPVTVGQKIGDNQGLCVPVHASVSGTVKAVEMRAHTSGTTVMSVVIENDHLDTLCEDIKPRTQEEVDALSPEELIGIIREGGIVGMGGATFPTHVKLSGGSGKGDTVIINAGECEPYITADDRLCREHPAELMKGLKLIMKIFGLAEGHIAIEDNKPDAIELKEMKGEIEFRDVWFAYNPGEWVLKGVSFHVYPKQTVAFVGATGSGKSTILSLICRNYDIQKGQILIDGIDIRHIKIASLRSHFGQMLQDVFLFAGDIRSNIVLREEGISDEDILQVCRYVNADKFIDKLDHGLDEEVRERGNNFSAGQRQLLSFARTIIHKPSVMILDEATANIDTETELLIQDSLEKMRSVGTMLIVAHRLSTIQHADNIIVLSHGKILEQGNHQELLAKHGRYYQLYTLQYHKHLLEV